MMKTWMKLILPALLAASCVGTGLDVPGDEVDAEGVQIRHGMIVLGERLEDPYSVENMSQALAAVYPTKADRIVLPATHLYVRFLPADEEQLARLEQLGIPLLDHPVDYRILCEGDYYHDPSIEEDRITWQYGVVDKDFVFPAGIRHEILDKCYIPGVQSAVKSDGVDWQAVEREAFRLTGNADMITEASGTKAETAVTPKGRITIVDSVRGGAPEGVRGVRVSCNSFVKFSAAYTDENGYYHYVGRADDVIKSSGYRIGPAEIENVIMELPFVLECGVSAAPDPVRGQVVKASIVLVKGVHGTDTLKEEVQRYVKEHTAPYKYPRIVVFRDELPKTISGKIQRNLL